MRDAARAAAAEDVAVSVQETAAARLAASISIAAAEAARAEAEREISAITAAQTAAVARAVQAQRIAETAADVAMWRAKEMGGGMGEGGISVVLGHSLCRGAARC